MHFIVLALLFVTTTARAGGIVLESYTGERPADATRLLAPMLEELSSRKFVAGDTLARTYDGQVSRPAQTGAGLPSDFGAQVDAGMRAWISGKFDDAIRKLSPVIDQAHANPGAFARDQALREPLLKALIALALSQQRNGDPGATRAAFSEILRSFPDTQLSRGQYGPDAAELFEQVKREILASGKGKLVVKVSDENSVVYINERLAGAGSLTADMLPGDYRVFVMLNKQPSRIHRVTVRANAEVAITVDVKRDQAVRTTGWTGFAFASPQDREAHEAQYAAQFANLLGANAVAVVGIDNVRGRPAIVGSLVSLQTGREIRRASVATEPDPSVDRLRALAKFLAGEEAGAGIEVALGEGAKAEPKGDEHHDDAQPVEGGKPRWPGIKWIAGGVGVAAMGVGVYLVAVNGGCSNPMPGRPCNDVYNTITPGLITLGAGAALVGAAAYLFITEKKPAKTAYVVPTGDGAVVGLSIDW